MDGQQLSVRENLNDSWTKEKLIDNGQLAIRGEILYCKQGVLWPDKFTQFDQVTKITEFMNQDERHTSQTSFLQL